MEDQPIPQHAKQAHGRKTIAVLMMKLNTPSFVRGVATQGRNSYNPAQYVTAYQVSFSEDCKHFQYVMNETNQPMVFEGNTDKDTVVIHMFNQWVKTSCVRISPKSFFGHISLRFDVIGCPDWKIMFIAVPGRGGLVEDWLTTVLPDGGRASQQPT
ncbi:NRX4-like protein, partial [Mya arenaria]